MNKTSSSSFSVISLVLATAILATLTGCNNVSPAAQNSSAATSTVMPITLMQPATKIPADLSPAMQAVISDYASASYAKRAQGSDWVAVMISANGTEQINIKVRARSDVKKPTCIFDGQATLIGQDNAHGVIFETTANDSKVFLQFKGDKLTIDSADKYALNTFCSGGGSIVGDYQKLAGKVELN